MVSRSVLHILTQSGESAVTTQAKLWSDSLEILCFQTCKAYPDKAEKENSG